MTTKRRNLIALFAMSKVLSDRFYEHPEAADRQACSDAGFITGPTKPPTQELRALMAKLCHYPVWDAVENLVLRDGDLAYRWMMYHVATSSDEYAVSITLRRKIGNQARDSHFSEIQLIEFYRLLLVDSVNDLLAQVEEETPLRSE